MDAELIRKSIQSIMEGSIPLVSAWCTVTAVDWDKKTCDVFIDDDKDLTIEGILLGFDKAGTCSKPKVNTDVLVMFINNTKTVGAVMMVEECEEMALMGKNYKGIPMVDPLVDKFNALEEDLNNLKSALNQLFNAGTTPVVEAGNGAVSGFQAAGALVLATYNSNTLTPTVLNDLENKKVLHGNGQ